MPKFDWKDYDFKKRDIWIPRMMLVAQFILGLIILVVLINIITPIFLRDEHYYVYKDGCFGVDVNDTCLGIVLFERTLIGP